jgi:hypothetical protein
MITATQTKSFQPAQAVLCQRSIRAKKRILEEIVSSINDPYTRRKFRGMIQHYNTSNELNQLAVDIYTSKEIK